MNRKNQPKIEDYATIEGYAETIPIYAFGYTYVYGIGPDLLPGTVMQDDNANPVRKFKPKKSWEITSNYCGSTPGREPKTMWNDDQPLLPVHLIDGDPETAWASRGMTAPNVQPEWIRIDLPMESTVAAVALVCSKKGPHPDPKGRVGKSLPKHLTVKLSRDGAHWETVYEDASFSGDDSGRNLIGFEPCSAKMIWVIGQGFERGDIWGSWGPTFSLGELEVLEPDGNNMALISRGAGVQVSSTYYGYGMDRFTQDMLWPIQYDLGFKWTRVGYDMSMYLWAYVEREKGTLRLDPKADAAVTQAHENGVNVIMVLDKANWLYQDPPRKTDWRMSRIYEMMETYYDHQGWPHESPELLEGWQRYVEFMVRHFKGRVAYYEICNEWPSYIGVDNYLTIVDATIPVIKSADPDARIMLGAVQPIIGDPFDAETLLACLRSGEPKLATQVDAISWHPFYQPDPESPEFRNYRENFVRLKEKCQELGFNGAYCASEWAFMAPYPLTTGPNDWGDGSTWTSEMQKAKYSARLMTAHAGMGIISLFNETFQTGRLEREVSLLRNSTFQVDPITPSQPQAAYYVLRNISTVLDGCEPAAFDVTFSGEKEFECYTFGCGPEKLLLAAWTPGRTGDAIGEATSDVRVPGVRAKSARVFDVFNGTEQELLVRLEGGSTLLKGIRVKDYPTFIQLVGAL